MYWTVIFKISATVLLLTAGLLAISHAVLGIALKNLLLGTATLSGVVAAMSAFKLKDIDKAHSASDVNRLHSHSEKGLESHEHSGGSDADH